jgi:GT2 family glycosyltransferase
MTIGVVIVTFNAQDIILDCLESLLASADVDLRIVVVDNASRDDTVALIRNWAAKPDIWLSQENSHFIAVSHGAIALTDQVPAAGATEIALIAHPVNTGFAGGVNIGLRLLRDDPEVDYFWILNPDCVAETHTAARLEQVAAKSDHFGLIGGRVFYKKPDLMIQSDGGRINFNTGTCIPFNMTLIGRDIPAPAGNDLDYIPGMHMLASRAFLDQAGLMPEDYFLYYEEMDWCSRRGDLGMHFCAEAAVHHDGGHSLGSATVHRGPSAMSSYFMGRSRMRFVRRYRPIALPIAFIYSVAKSVKYILKGQFVAGFSLLRGVCGLKPPLQIREQLRPSSNSLI